MLLNCRHIIFMFCAFPRNWVPAFKINTSNLVPLFPGIWVLYVWGTQKKGGQSHKNRQKTDSFIEIFVSHFCPDKYILPKPAMKPKF